MVLRELLSEPIEATMRKRLESRLGHKSKSIFNALARPHKSNAVTAWQLDLALSRALGSTLHSVAPRVRLDWLYLKTTKATPGRF